MSNLYNYLSKRDLNIQEWKIKLRKKFKVHLKECNPTWIYDQSQSWPEIDTLNIFQTTNIYEAIAHELVRKSNETAALMPADQRECAGYIYKETRGFENEKDTITSVESTRLFTCYEAPKVSFHMYVSPLDTAAWLLVSIQAIVVGLLLKLFMILKEIKTSFSVSLFIIRTLIDEANPIPNFLKSQRR